MDKIVALCKRRGFIFPSSEIYGGLGSTYDYGHYGVLLKTNVKNEWWRAMLQDRDDIVALDSAILQHPRVWEASGHLAGFTDPMVDCSTCKQRFRADHLDELQCPQKPSKHPGEGPDCDLTEARDFNLMFETTVGPVKDSGVDRLPAPRDRAGHLHQLQERPAVRPQEAAVRHRAGRQVVPQRDHARATSSSARASSSRWRWSSSCRPAEADAVVRVLVRRALRAGTPDLGIRPDHLRLRAARGRRALALLERHERRRVPLPDRLVRARGHRQPRQLRPDPARRVLRREARVLRPGQRRALRPARDRAGRRRRPRDARVPRRRLRRGGARGRRRAPSCACTRAWRRSRSRCCRWSGRTASPSSRARSATRCAAGMQAEYDEGGSIGKRYRRQDEIGTPWCVTIDHQSLEDRTVTRARPRLAEPGARRDRRPARAAQRAPGRGLDQPEAPA